MSIDNPPIYSGITYNSAFFVEDTGGLSQAQANALYLRKTVPDTATAEETFSGGIKTDTIKPRTTGGTNLFNDATGNVITSSICPNNNSSSYGYNNSIVTVGESSKFMRIGGSMPSTSGNYILIGGANSQTTNIGIGSDGDVGLLSGTNKMVIGATTKTMTLNSSALTVNAPATFQNQMRLYGATNTFLQADDQTTPTSSIRLQTLASNPSILLTGAGGSNTITISEIGTSTGLGFSICPNQNTGDLQIANGTRTGNILMGTKSALIFGSNKIVVGAAGNDTLLMSDTISLYNPLTPAYTYTQTTTSTGGEGTPSGKIGYIYRQPTAYATIVYSGGDRTYAWLSVTAGVYLVQYSSNPVLTTNYMYTYLATSPNVPVYNGLFNATGSVRLDESYLLNDIGLAGNKQLAASGTFATNTTIYIVLISNIFTSGTPTGGYGYSLVITRIA